MALPRTFVSFSSADIDYYRTMMMWNANEHIDFDFADFQLDDAIKSENEHYIKDLIRRKIVRSDTYALLIGTDTWTKTTYVKWEVEVAIETGCRLIGVNINDSRFPGAFCPTFFADKGAVFVPFSSRILAKALEPWEKQRSKDLDWTRYDWYFYDWVYTGLGYNLEGNTAVLPQKLNPYALRDALMAIGRAQSGKK